MRDELNFQIFRLTLHKQTSSVKLEINFVCFILLENFIDTATDKLLMETKRLQVFENSTSKVHNYKFFKKCIYCRMLLKLINLY